MIKHLINPEYTRTAELERQAETQQRIKVMAPDDCGNYPEAILSAVLHPSEIHLIMHECHRRNLSSEYCLHIYAPVTRVQRKLLTVDTSERNFIARRILIQMHKGLGNLIAEMEPETHDQA